MVVMPLSGYVFTLAGGYNFKLFGLVALPQLIAKNAAVAATAQFGPAATADAIGTAVGLPPALAIQRHAVDKDGFLHRMLPF
jgi:cytochrome b561